MLYTCIYGEGMVYIHSLEDEIPHPGQYREKLYNATVHTETIHDSLFAAFCHIGGCWGSQQVYTHTPSRAHCTMYIMHTILKHIRDTYSL